MALDLAELAKSLKQQKAKYHAKVLSDDAIYVNWVRSLDTEDLFSEDASVVVAEMNMAQLGFALAFGIAPADLVPLNLEFKTELPTTSEFLQGILVKTDLYDLTREFEWMLRVMDYMMKNMEEAFASIMIITKPEKLVFDETKYDASYVDPQAVYEFIRATMFKFFVERKTLEQVKSDLEAMAKALNVNPSIVKYVFERLSLLASVRASAFVLGYSLLGKSTLTKRGSEEFVVEYVDYDLTLREARLKTFEHGLFGMVLGLTPLGLGYLLPPQRVLRAPGFVNALGHTVPGSPPMIEVVRRKLRRLRSTYALTGLALANYSRPAERRSVSESDRAHQWMQLQAYRYLVESLVEAVVGDRERSPLKLRMYKSAALQLVSLKFKRHKWGYEAFKAASADELYRWWREHWASMGLDPRLLDEIYERLKRWFIEWGRTKEWVGRRLAEIRKMAAALA